MFKFDCQYRLGSQSPAVCLWQSQRLGQVAHTSYLFCDQCPLQVRSQGKEDKDFLKKCFNRRYDKDFLNKLYHKYDKQTDIVVPNNWQEINNYFNNLKQYDWFIDIGLTGSYIVKGLDNHKDIDIILWIKNITDYVSWSKANSLPTHFNSIKIDYYIFLEPYYQFFISLWPNQEKIYVNNYFTANIKSNNIQIIHNDFYDKLLDSTDITLY
jgi:hypothetical protein